nr:MAG TPA: hypothetical protein [Caudoviricetes sp.]
MNRESNIPYPPDLVISNNLRYEAKITWVLTLS